MLNFNVQLLVRTEAGCKLLLLFFASGILAAWNCHAKCANKKGDHCRWFGDCDGQSETVDCPEGFEQQMAIPCENSPYDNQQFFCCKKGVNYKGMTPRYLTPADHANAKTFPDVIATIETFLPYIPIQTKNAQKFDNPWPGAKAPYTLDPSFSETDRAEVAKAIKNYHDNTCFKFFPKRDEDEAWIAIQGDDATDTGKNCGKSILCGPHKGGQYSKFGGSCRNAEWMVHELGHSICFNHEQDRYDRDNYIYFNESVCTASTKKSQEKYTTLDLPFDFGSSQMYPGCRKGDCIQRVEGQGSGRCGNKWDGTGRLSPTDIKKVNKYYNCSCDTYSC